MISPDKPQESATHRHRHPVAAQARGVVPTTDTADIVDHPAIVGPVAVDNRAVVAVDAVDAGDFEAAGGDFRPFVLGWRSRVDVFERRNLAVHLRKFRQGQTADGDSAESRPSCG